VSILRRLALVLSAALGSLSLLAAADARTPTPGPAALVEVVVTLPQPPLAEAIQRDRQLARATTTNRRLNLRAPAAVSYLRTLATAQRALQARIAIAIPGAAVRWHYGVVLNGLAVALPHSQLARLGLLPGIKVWPSVTYHSLSTRGPQLIGAPTVWGPMLATTGTGQKVAIIDDGLDQSHTYFEPTGYTYPAGFPRGNTAYTTPKVIVAKAFSPATSTWKYGNTPFDPQYSDHATHVAGIAAGNHDTLATTANNTRVRASGVAPGAYIGNYKVLTVPTEGFGLDGNSPEIAKGIEEAVKDGMDVINLSLGEPEIEQSRDIVVAALDHAADAGVVPVVAAGNEFVDGGRGTIGSPGTAPKAITVAAATIGDHGPVDTIAYFSSSGPTPLSLELKPDVTAPGVDILSSFPDDQWTELQGTSMASPHVAGAAALLRQRHPTWTVAQIKSALVSTGDTVRSQASSAEVSVLREGGGRIDLARADNPLVFVDPTNIAFGLVRRGSTATRQLNLVDAGGGAAPWTATLAPQATPTGVTLSLSAPTAAPGAALGLTLAVGGEAAEGDAVGFVELARGSDVRKIPYWAHVEVPRLQNASRSTLRGPGLYSGNTAGKTSVVSSYRYPEGGFACNCKTGVQTDLSGPEQVFRLAVKQKVANVGAVVVSHAPGVRVSPRLVVAGDENRLLGFTALPVNNNPYQLYGRVEPVVGAVLPAPGTYDFVFDTPVGARPGKFSFRVWVNDVAPPSIRLLAPQERGTLRLAVSDAGSGVDAGSVVLRVDGRKRSFTYRGGILSSRGIAAGKHHLTLTASDYQEAKNMENTGPILPNTRTFSAPFVVR
jgi:subtilisin family serine protease